MALRLSEGLGVAEAEPSAYGILNIVQLNSSERSDRSNQASVRHSHQALGIKGPRLQEPCWDNNFELRASHARRVWNQGNKRAIRVFSCNAQNHARSDLCSKPKIDKPDLTAGR